MHELRYYARFSVVCLLTGRRQILSSLLAELQGLLESLGGVGCPTAERGAWGVVLGELRAFVEIDQPVAVPYLRLRPQVTRLQAALVASCGVLPPLGQRLKLTEAVIVGASASQAKVSELSLDVFRVLHSIEWDAPSCREVTSAAGASTSRAMASSRVSAGSAGSTGAAGVVDDELSAPRKYLLHRPTVPQLLLVLSTTLAELRPLSAVLLYISADGLHSMHALQAGTRRQRLHTHEHQPSAPLSSANTTTPSASSLPSFEEPLQEPHADSAVNLPRAREHAGGGSGDYSAMESDETWCRRRWARTRVAASHSRYQSHRVHIRRPQPFAPLVAKWRPLGL